MVSGILCLLFATLVAFETAWIFKDLRHVCLGIVLFGLAVLVLYQVYS